ncbi:MBG domain-containing protein [Echinicola jeungdonensis]|uniref:MBG domain-containing protein n=1 Tax=Echinicola jeungdonensis TaxID=709343 RepID=A0ABV5J1Y4_9BACT
MEKIYGKKLLKGLFPIIMGLLLVFQVSGQTFTEDFEDETTGKKTPFSSSSNEASVSFDYEFTSAGDGGIGEVLDNFGVGDSKSLDLLSNGSTGAIETFRIKRTDGAEFDFTGIYVANYGGDVITVQGYRSSSSVGSPQTVSNGDIKSLTFNVTVDEVHISSSDFFLVNIDEFSGEIVASNSAPTASSFTASNGPYENLTYTFSTSDFGYSDGDGDVLDHLLIESVPGSGTLYVDADNDDVYDGGEEVSTSDQVSKADLDAGNLQYIQNGSTNTSFQFEVNDGTDTSTGNYTATLNVSAVPTVTLSLSPSSKSESLTSNNVVTATLSNSYGANTTVNLSFGGTATNSVDYNLSGTSITVPAGSTSGTINLSNISDAIYEGNETVVIDISSVSNGTESGTQQETYTIIDDDPQPNASLELLNVYNPITDESGGQAYIRGKIDNIAGVTVTIPLTFSGTATGGGTDYSITGSSITISPGEPMDSIRVTSIFDGIEEGDETVIIDMDTPTNAVEDGTQQVTLTINDEDAAPPSGYSVSIDQSSINAFNESDASFTFSGAEVGTDYDYTFSSSGGGTDVTGNGTISTTTDQISNIDLSGLPDGTITLSVTLKDSFGNTGTAATDTKTKDATAPSGYIATFDQSGINASNESAISFTFGAAEVGAGYDYSISSSGGGTNVTGSGTVVSSTDQITGLNLSGLNDGTLSLSVTLTDDAGNTGSTATDTETKDTAAPTGYSVTIDQNPINSGNESAVSFTFASAEVGTDYDYTISSSGGGTNVTGSGTLITATDQITGLDVSGLGDGTLTLSVTLTDGAGNTGSAATDTESKDTTAPLGYAVSLDQSPINTGNETATSFTFASAEVGADYNYTLSSSGGGTDVTGSGTISTATDNITGLDLSGLGEGTVTLSVTLTDAARNTGTAATDTETKDTTAPSGYSVTFDQSPINGGNEPAVSFTFASAEVGASYNYTLSSSGGGTNVTGSGTIGSATEQVNGLDVSGLVDGTITLSVTLTDTNGNTGTAATDTETKDTEAPTGYSVVLDQSPVNAGNESAVSFTFVSAEVGADYSYTLSSSGGGSNVTGSGTITTATDNITGLDVSGLEDGTITLSVTLTDVNGNTGTVATDTETKDTAAPSGYSVTIDQNPINAGNESAVSFTFASAEVGADYSYTLSSSGGGTNVTGSGTIGSSTEQVSGLDVSGLADGTITLSVTLTDVNGNTGTAATDTETKDTAAPSGYSVTIDQSPINAGNESAVSFTFASAEVGADYSYALSSSGGGSNVTGSGTITTTTDNITGLDVSGLADGTITLSVTLTDVNGNTGTAATDTETKDTAAPSGYSVTIDQNPINAGNESAVSFTFGSAEVGSTYNYTLSSSGGGTNVTGSGTIGSSTEQVSGLDVSGLADGTITLSVTLTDVNGNTGTATTDTETKDTAAPSGYSVTIDQSPINAGNESSVSFTFASAEVGADYSYTLSSSGGGTNVTGSGTISTATDQITGLDVSGLGDGAVTLSVTLTDANGNTGTAVTDTETKDSAVPSGYSVTIDQNPINAGNESSVSFTFVGAEVGTDFNYTISSTGGSTNVTGSGTISSATDNITGLDLSGLGDGTVTLSVTLTDANGNTGTAASDTKTKDATVPSGYSATFDQSPINNNNQNNTNFTFASAEVGSTYNYTLSSSGGGTNVTGSGTISTATDNITGLDLSGLADGTITLSVTLTDANGNAGTAATDTETKDTAAPAGYSVSFDQDPIDEPNQNVASFTFTSAEVGATYDYNLVSSGGGTNVTGSGTISTATDQITGLDLSGLGDGTITLSVTLTDPAGNTGSTSTDTSTKDTNDAPTASSLSINGALTIGEVLTGNYTFTDPDGDTESGTTYQWYLSDDNAGTGKTAISGATNQQYTLQSADQGKYIGFEVTPNDGKDAGTTVESTLVGPVKIDQTITFPSIPTKTYGDPSFTLGVAQTDQGLTVTYTADDPTVVSISGNQATILKAGSTQITAAQSGDGVTNAATDITQNLTVDKATLTVTADNKTKVYGEIDPTLTVSYAGFTNGDDETALGRTLDISRAAGEDVGSYTIGVSGYTSGNYTINYVDGTFEVTEATLTVTADDKTKVYGETDPTLTVSYAGFTNGDDETALGGTLDISRAAGEDVGNYTITASGYTSGNYTINYVDGTFEITKASLTVTADDKTKVYGETDPTLTVSYAGFTNGDDETALGGTLDISRAAGEDVGSYTIGVSGYTSGNYTINYVDGTFEVTEATLTVTADDKTKVYGETDPTLTVSYAGFTNGDDETALGGMLDISRSAGEDVGNYTITAIGYTSGNYNINYVDGTFEITKASLTVTADDKTKVYGEADPTLTVSYAGFENGDDKTALGGTLDISRAAGEDVGNYTITAIGYTSGNYNINYVDGNFEVTQASLTVTADDKTKVYGEADPTLTVSYAGFENGDDKTALGGTLDISRAAGEDVGNYTITAIGYTSGNYTINYVDGTFEVTEATLTVTAVDKTKVYGETDPTLTVSYAGFENGDDEAALGGMPDISRAAGEDVGNYIITATGYTSSNYTIKYVDGNFEIRKATLTVTADTQLKIFGQEDPELTYQASGFKNGDGKEVMSGALARASGEDVGGYPILIGTLDAGNDYKINFTGANLTIQARKIEEVIEPALVEVEWGMELEQVDLPATVLVRTEANEFINLEVEWIKSGIDTRSSGDYRITGRLQLQGSISGEALPVPSMYVVVLPKPLPENILLDNNSFEASVENNSLSIGTFTIEDPADNQHEVILVPGVEDNDYFILDGRTLFWNSEEALPGRTQFTVEVRVIDADGNVMVKTYTITREREGLEEIELTNTFSPNGDGANDTWGVPELKFFEGIRIMIFEKSGKRVFLTDNPEVKWDGTYNGEFLAPGAYFWVIKNQLTGEIRRGVLNLISR